MAGTSAAQKITKGTRTRQFIKDTVLEMYRQPKTKSVTLDRILKATDLTVGAFYFHFKSKDELLEEIAIDCCNDYHAEIVDRVAWDAGFFQIANDIIGSSYQTYIDNPSFTKMMYAVVYKSPKAYAGWRKSRKILRQRIEDAITSATQGRRKVDLDPTFTSYWLLSSLEDFLFSVFMAQGSQKLRQIASSKEAFVDQQAILWYRSVMGEDPSAIT
ncbi:MAG: TetR/AcrR family transcriptional regulator [Pseudomonadota bacterium]